MGLATGVYSLGATRCLSIWFLLGFGLDYAIFSQSYFG